MSAYFHHSFLLTLYETHILVVGNPHSVGQQPITFFRQVASLTDLGDDGIYHPDVLRMFPTDVVERAKTIQRVLEGSGTGAYTGSQGALGFRKDVARFIEERDEGHPAYPGNIFLSNGASSAIELVLTTIMSTELCGGEFCKVLFNRMEIFAVGFVAALQMQLTI